MSSYASLAQLKAHVGSAADPPGLYEQLTDLVASRSGDDAVGQQRLDDAEAFINGRLGGRYRTPVDASADEALASSLRACALAIAAWNLYANHPDKPRVRDSVRAEYDRWVGWLDRVASGASALPGAAELPGPVSAGPPAVAIGHKRVFTEEALKGL